MTEGLKHAFLGTMLVLIAGTMYLVEDRGQYWYSLTQTIGRTAEGRKESRFLGEHADEEIRRRLLAIRERGDFAGAYKLHGKQWRIPASAVDAFQDHQRTVAGPRRRDRGRLSAWRSVRSPGTASRPQSGPGAVTVWSPSGNAEE